MGWLFYAETKEELVNDLVQVEDGEQCRIQVIAHRVVGSQLWMVKEYTANVQIDAKMWFDGRDAVPGDTFRLIGLALMRKESGGSRKACWGYKTLDESMHPFYFSCPLSFFKLAPEITPKWREAVRQWHAEKQDKTPSTWKSWRPGDIVRMPWSSDLYVIASPNYSRGTVRRHLGWMVRRVNDDRLFRLVGRALRDASRASPGERT